MTTNNKSLKDDTTKELVLELSRLGHSSYSISEVTGISPRNIQYFLAKDIHKEWWTNRAEREISAVAKWMEPTDLLDVAMKLHYDVKDTRMSGVPSKAGAKAHSEMLELIKSGMERKFALETKDAHSMKILVIADTQCKPGESLDYMKWIGKYIFDKKPDVVVHIGDSYDMPSLSSYDKGKKSFEGRRLKADLEAGTRGLELLLAEFQKDDYNPRMVFCLGNHEERIDRLANDMPELEGFIGVDLLPLASMGWEVQPFLKPIEIEGIFFVHYLANPFTGKPFAGTALSQLKTVGRSFVVGHKQCLDVAIRPTLDGKQQIGIINGAAYDFDEAYKGPQLGNNHFRGITMLHEVKDGFGLPSFISLDYLKSKYKEGL